MPALHAKSVRHIAARLRYCTPVNPRRHRLRAKSAHWRWQAACNRGRMRPSSASASLIIHVVALLALLLISSAVRREQPIYQASRRATRLEAPRLRTEQGGGSDRAALPPRLGRLPERTRQRIFVLPMIPRVDEPRLPLQQALLEA